MRFLALTACAAICLAACGKKESTDQNIAAVENLGAETISSNDTTAIDAASGADANMAEDVELTVNDLEGANATDIGNEKVAADATN